MPRHRQDLAVVRAALDDHIDLDRRESGRLGGCDAVEDGAGGKVGVVHALEQCIVERVEANGDAGQAGRFQVVCFARKQRAVGGQREVERPSIGRRQGSESLDELLDAFAQQRLAARESNLVDAMCNEDAREPLDFFEGEQRAMRKKRVVAAEDGARHAIDAPEVASIGDGNTQIAQWPRERIG